MQIICVDSLVSWLTNTLNKICDADPAALARYVLALIKKDKTDEELRKEMVEQLDVFLQKETRDFVDRLFVALESKEYLNSSSVEDSSDSLTYSSLSDEKLLSLSSSSQDESTTPAPGKGDAKDGAASNQVVVKKEEDRDRQRRKSRSPRRSRSRERVRRSRSPRDNRPRYRGPVRRQDRDRRRTFIRNRSLSPRAPIRYKKGANHVRSRSRSPIGGRKQSPNREVKVIRHGDLTVKKESETKPTSQSSDESEGSPTKVSKRCRDFEERGLCMRGDLCPFDHGRNPVVLEDIPSGLDTTADLSTLPLEDRAELFSLAAAVESQYIPRPPHPGGLEDQLSSSDSDGSSGWSDPIPYTPLPVGAVDEPPPPPYLPQAPSCDFVSMPVNMPGGLGAPQLGKEVQGPYGHYVSYPSPIRGMHSGRGRGRGGIFEHGRLGAKPIRNYANCSIEVKKIPIGLNNITELNSHFWKFGKIINIQINFENDPEAALITFSSPHEAQAAMRCTEAVLNNRFIRVFWHNKEKENEDEETPNPYVPENVGSFDSYREKSIMVSEGANHLYNPTYVKKEPSIDKVQAVEAIKKSQEMLAAQESLKRVQEEKQKEALKLKSELHKKKQTMLQQQIEQQKKLIAKLENPSTKPNEKDELMVLLKTLQGSIESIKKDLDKTAQMPTFSGGAKNQTQKAILDAELELYQKELQGGDTVALKTKVYELREKAKAAGYYPSRGRGGWVMGNSRGGFIQAPLRSEQRPPQKVDRRPTKIRVSGFPHYRVADIVAHFAQFGVMESYETDHEYPGLILTYETRKSAEIAMAKGKMYLTFLLDIEWVTPPSTTPPKVVTRRPIKPEHEDMENESSNDEDVPEGDGDEMDFLEEEEEVMEEEEEDLDDRSWRR